MVRLRVALCALAIVACLAGCQTQPAPVIVFPDGTELQTPDDIPLWEYGK